MRACSGEDERGAHEEEEVGEDEVGQRPAVPRGVIELRIDMAPVAGIVDQDHEGDSDAAEEIDREDAPGHNGGHGSLCIIGGRTGGRRGWDLCRRIRCLSLWTHTSQMRTISALPEGAFMFEDSLFESQPRPVTVRGRWTTAASICLPGSAGFPAGAASFAAPGGPAVTLERGEADGPNTSPPAAAAGCREPELQCGVCRDSGAAAHGVGAEDHSPAHRSVSACCGGDRLGHDGS